MNSKEMMERLKELQKLEGKRRFANLGFDMPFKKAFGTEGEEEPLIATLNVCLESELAHPITAVEIKNPYIIGQTRGRRDANLDIRCKDSKGNEFIVEMQTGVQKHFIKRAAFYSSDTIVASAPKDRKKNKWDYNFPNVYSLNFLHFDLPVWKGNDVVIHPLCYTDKIQPDVQFDFSSLVFVRLSEFKKSLRECESFKDKLLFSIRHAHELDEQPPQLEGEVLDKIFQAAKIANFTSEEYADYMNGVRGDWDHWAEMDYAKEIGFTAGREEGIAVGRDEGIAVGETKVLDLMAQGYGYEQIKELLSK